MFTLKMEALFPYILSSEEYFVYSLYHEDNRDVKNVSHISSPIPRQQQKIPTISYP